MIVSPIIASFARREMSPPLPNEVTRANAGGPRPLQIPGVRCRQLGVSGSTAQRLWADA